MTASGRPKSGIVHCPICSSHEESVTEQIASKLMLRRFDRGAIVCSQEDPCRGLYIIGKGTVKVFRLTAEGKETVLAVLSSGDTFGEASLHQKKHSESIAAMTDLEVFFLKQDDLEQTLRQYPTLYPSVINAMVRWVDRLNLVIDNISTASARERVAKYLRSLSADTAGTREDLNTIELPFKKHEVALMLGLRPETLSRAFSDLEQEGAIRLDHKKIHLLNPSSL